MTVFATRDHAGKMVTVSPGHGGCGRPHQYSDDSGFPAVTCPNGCEDHLRHDSQHAASPADVPETYDEKRAREMLEKRSAQHSQDLTALMLARMAGDKSAEALQRQLMGVRGGGDAALCAEGHPNPLQAKFCGECGAPVTAAGTALCPQGHENAPGQKFCGECGASMHSAPPERQIASPAPSQRAQERPQEHSQAQGEGDASRKAPAAPGGLSALHPQKLRKMCREAGLDDSGKVPDLVARLETAGVQAPA